ncbi:MAG: hypothetical protein RL748_3387 [Pseudomonadota bacterium]|jgi:two-component system sensor histidine kinase DctS
MMIKLPTLSPFTTLPARKWRGVIPALLVLLFLATLALLPWQARRLEDMERQEQLIADTLWLEQTILFQVQRNDEVLRTLAKDLQNQRLSPAAVQIRFNHLRENEKEIVQLDWLDQHGLQRASSPESATPLENSTGKNLLPSNASSRCWLTSSTRLQCAIAINHSKAGPAGQLMVSYHLPALLEQMVPWWFAQNNQVSLLDGQDKLLATRSVGGPGQHVYTHRRALDLFGETLYLQTDSTRQQPPMLSNMLVVSILALALGLLWSLLALWRDILRRRKIEDELRQQVAFSSAMENSIIVGMRARDMVGNITYVNAAFCAMVGYAREQIIGQLPPMLYWAPEAVEQDQARFDLMMAGQVSSSGIETIYLRANGERFPVLVHDSPLINEQGQQTGWMSSILDISELKQAQALMRKQQDKVERSARLATIGEIGSTLAHELNQPLAAISSYASGAMNMISAGKLDAPALLQAMQRAQEQAQRAGQVIRSVHEFVKKREAKRELLDVCALIINLLPMMQLQSKASQIKLEGALLPAPGADDAPWPLVMADKILIEQVLLNLSRNASEAMAACAPEQRIVRIHASCDTQQVQVAVIDQGCGIDASVADQLFTPFVTTKKNGMGLGLNICRSAIEFHGGTLEHQPNPQGGTIFTFTLPLPTAEELAQIDANSP